MSFLLLPLQHCFRKRWEPKQRRDRIYTKAPKHRPVWPSLKLAWAPSVWRWVQMAHGSWVNTQVSDLWAPDCISLRTIVPSIKPGIELQMIRGLSYIPLSHKCLICDHTNDHSWQITYLKPATSSPSLELYTLGHLSSLVWHTFEKPILSLQVFHGIYEKNKMVLNISVAILADLSSLLGQFLQSSLIFLLPANISRNVFFFFFFKAI